MELALLTAITDLGDSALMLPLALILAMVLWSQQSTAAALAWIGTLLPGLAIMTTLKLAGLACGGALDTPDLSPSGHAAFATMVYGSAAVIVARHTTGVARWLAGFAAAGLVVTVSASRLLLEMHTKLEVAVGLIVGGATVALFASVYRRLPPATTVRSRGVAVAASLVVLLVVALHGERLHAEDVIRSIAAELRTQVSACR